MLFYAMENMSFFTPPTFETILGVLYPLILNVAFAVVVPILWENQFVNPKISL
jgi:hypothetical protein